MGILNCTPDSFYDGNSMDSKALAQKALAMFSEGANIVDIGGESSRPGSKEVSIDEECARVLPVIRLIRESSDGLLSIDTRKPAVAREAIKSGVQWVNDISAGSDAKMLDLVAQERVVYVAMHMKGLPEFMQDQPQYDDVLAEIEGQLLGVSKELTSRGHPQEKICWDPGIGFGKKLSHNLEILKNLHRFTASGFPVLLGVSRKSFMAGLSSSAGHPKDRLPGSLAVIPSAIQQGVRMFRVHDVWETRQFMDILTSITQEV